MKKIIFPFLACIALPTSIQANVDPKVAEICMKAADFKGCVESMSGMKKMIHLLNLNMTKPWFYLNQGIHLEP